MKNKTHKISAAMIAACALFAPLASHADVWCPTYIDRALTQYDGNLMIFTTSLADWQTICNVNTIYNGITPTTCMAWFASANSSILYNKPVLLFFPTGTACTTANLGTYTTTKPLGYLLLAKQ
jgi:hypothetical protein